VFTNYFPATSEEIKYQENMRSKAIKLLKTKIF
jgi:hypothetical protein